MASINASSWQASRIKVFLKSTVMFLVASFIGLLFGAVIIALSGKDPILGYKALFTGAFGGVYNIGEVLLSTTPLILSGLAVAVAFHCGLLNMGVEGQLVMGAFMASWVGFTIAGLPWIVHFPLCLLAGMLGGAIWSMLAGILKATRGIHEVISTIMLNYIAFKITTYTVSSNGPLKAEGLLPATPVIFDSAILPRLFPDLRLNGGIFIALLAAVIVGYLLWNTRIGYCIRAVGKSKTGAEFGGISYSKNVLLTMFISGSLAGLAGAIETLGLYYRFYSSFSPGYGFDAIAIALLGDLHPLGVVIASLLFGVLRVGSIQLQQTAGISRDIIYAISGIIIFFIALREAILGIHLPWNRRKDA